jgi:hypothetical protein
MRGQCLSLGIYEPPELVVNVHNSNVWSNKPNRYGSSIK